jgi:hypothetical protein
MKMAAFCDIAPCSLVEVDRRFRGAYCHHQYGALMMEAVNTFETSANFYHKTEQYPRGLSSSNASCFARMELH